MRARSLRSAATTSPAYTDRAGHRASSGRIGRHRTSKPPRPPTRRTYAVTALTVLILLGEALPAKSIAARLGISVRTVQKHMHNLYRKLATKDRMETALLAQSLGLLSRDPPS